MKTKIYKAMVFLIISLLICTSLHATKIKYFKDYQITFWDYSVIPGESLPEKEALRSMCNKFIYNDDGELIQIEGFAFGLNFLDTYEEVYGRRPSGGEQLVLMWRVFSDRLEHRLHIPMPI